MTDRAICTDAIASNKKKRNIKAESQSQSQTNMGLKIGSVTEDWDIKDFQNYYDYIIMKTTSVLFCNTASFSHLKAFEERLRLDPIKPKSR